MKFLIGLLLFSTPNVLFAEYRAFVLQITSADGQSVRSFVHNLDPDQYRGYYPLSPGEKIVYTDTWMCKGSTGSFQKICDKPVPVDAGPTDQKTTEPPAVQNLNKKNLPDQNETPLTGRQALQ